MSNPMHTRILARPLAVLLAATLAGIAPTAVATAAKLADPEASKAAALRRVPYQKYVAGDCDANSPGCYVEVETVKSGQRLEIGSLSCHAQIAAQGKLFFVALVADDSNEAKIDIDWFRPVKTSGGVSVDNFVVSRPTHFIADAGDRLYLHLSSDYSAKGLRCKVAGTRVKIG